ncbi:MAG: zinc-binding dehydrogenase [Candidatus Marsarchaeota archaeon]|jgi:threonine dehydrogenase-like Zn-dependent dehydrogenase|nr:zinc-binding dehydrogenase [Candidatus Marsarchaeota archaeon]
MQTYNALFADEDSHLTLKAINFKNGTNMAKILRSGVCGTDKHVIMGDIKDVKLPRVLGHENVGEIDGKRYVWPAIMPCGTCLACREGRYNLCEKNQVFGLTTEDLSVGGWAEYTPIPKDTVLYEVPDSVGDDEAVLIETVASTKPLHNVDVKGKNVLIIGSGAIGLVGAVHAKAGGASSITMVGHKEQAQVLGKIIDAFYEKNTSIETVGNQYDIVYDAGGDPTSCSYSINAVKSFGTVLESACMPHSFSVDLNTLIAKEAKLHTQYGYVPDDFKWAIDLVEQNLTDFKKVITNKFRLSEYDKALATILNKRYGKIMFSP